MNQKAKLGVSGAAAGLPGAASDPAVCPQAHSARHRVHIKIRAKNFFMNSSGQVLLPAARSRPARAHANDPAQVLVRDRFGISNDIPRAAL